MHHGTSLLQIRLVAPQGANGGQMARAIATSPPLRGEPLKPLTRPTSSNGESSHPRSRCAKVRLPAAHLIMFAARTCSLRPPCRHRLATMRPAGRHPQVVAALVDNVNEFGGFDRRTSTRRMQVSHLWLCRPVAADEDG